MTTRQKLYEWLHQERQAAQNYSVRLTQLEDLLTELKNDEVPQLVEPPIVLPPPVVSNRPAIAGHYLIHDVSGKNPNGTALVRWSEIEATLGRRNWQKLDAQVAGHEKILIQVYIHTTDSIGGGHFRTWLPHGAPAAYTIRSGNQSALIPAYDSRDLLLMQQDFICAMGQRYDGKIAGVIATTGLDGETQPAKIAGGVDWTRACFGSEANAVPYKFENVWVPKLMQAYTAAFPNTPGVGTCAPGGTAMRGKVALMAESLGIGLKNNGLWTDSDNHWGYASNLTQPAWNIWDDWSGEIGTWDAMRCFPELPLITESVHGQLYSAEQARDVLLAGLAYHPVAMVWHPEYFKMIPDWLKWSGPYLGVTKENTPGVWWAKHESPYPFKKSGSRGGFSGHLGDWEFFLRREGNTFIIEDRVDFDRGELRIGSPFESPWQLLREPRRFTVDGDPDWVAVRRA